MNIRVNGHQITVPAQRARELLRIVIVGDVDHGKSTLIGRLLHETGSLPEGKLDSLKAASWRRGMPFEWSFLLDALQSERNLGITIDTSQIRLRTQTRDVVLIDAPGHSEFLRNMITGAAQADAALLLIDAVEGVREQTRRHCYLLHLLGVRQVAVVVNKMDLLAFDAAPFRAIEDVILAHLKTLGLDAAAVIPISARNGDGVAHKSAASAWHDGPTVLEVLDAFTPARPADALALRLPVQAVYKFDARRIIAGRIETGRLAVGDEVVLMPGQKAARVRSIEAWPAGVATLPQAAAAGRSVGITLDRELFIDRGDVVCPAAAPARAAHGFRARVFWLEAAPLTIGADITVRIGAAESRGRVEDITDVVDPGHISATGGNAVAQNCVGEIKVALAHPIAADLYADNPRSGRVVLDVDGRIAGGGLVLAITPALASQPRRRRSQTAAPAAPAAPAAHDDLRAEADRLATALADLSPAERIARLRREVDGKIVFTTSFGLEDQAITHLLHGLAAEIDVATLDTGRLFPETYALWAETEARYGLSIRALYPRHDDLEALVARQGINGFYGSKPARLACCDVRKVEPLGRALAGARGWITGLRADQSFNRRGMRLVEADLERGLIKLAPFFDWTREAIEAFAADHAVPVNPLHAQGFASIGCAPCTRAIGAGEPERAGRWWWEAEDKKECGLHIGRMRHAKLPATADGS
jgi:bifunctional enzyme CysN/CysC